MSLYSTKLDQLYRFIGGKIILSRNLCRFIKGIHKFGPILSLHRCRKIFDWFFLSLHRWQKFWPTKLYRFIRFFSQKLCICIALNDFGRRLWPATLAGDFGWRLWPAKVVGPRLCDFGRRLWPGTLAGDFGRRLCPVTLAHDFGPRLNMNNTDESFFFYCRCLETLNL